MPRTDQKYPRWKDVTKLIDVTKCMGCKGCEVACKEWFELPAEIMPEDWTKSYQSHDDLSYNRYTMIRYFERPLEGEDYGVDWVFVKDQCMHCIEPPCVYVCPTGALHQTQEGIVDFDWEACIGEQYCVSACPFNIPKYDATDNKIDKCTLCYNRVAVGEEPACVKTCPPRAILFGEREEMLAIAGARIKELEAQGKTAVLYNPEGVGGTRVIYVLPGRPEEFGLPADPKIPAGASLWQNVGKPVGAALIGASALAALYSLGVGLSRSNHNGGGENAHAGHDMTHAGHEAHQEGGTHHEG